jgi:hypothetical protein
MFLKLNQGGNLMFFGTKSKECQNGDDITQIDGIFLQVTVSSYRTRGFSTLLLDFLQATGGFSLHSPLSAYMYSFVYSFNSSDLFSHIKLR